MPGRIGQRPTAQPRVLLRHSSTSSMPGGANTSQVGRVRSHWMGGQTAGAHAFLDQRLEADQAVGVDAKPDGADAERRRRSLERRQELCDRSRRACDQQPNSEPIAKFPHDPVDPRRLCRSRLGRLSADRSDATKATRRTSCGKARLRASRYEPQGFRRTSPHVMSLLLRPRRRDVGQANDLRSGPRPKRKGERHRGRVPRSNGRRSA